MNKIIENSLTVIIPCYNEEQAIPKFFPELISFCKNKEWYIIAVNDGSNDNTKFLLESITNYSKFKVISHKINRGYGGSIKTGIKNTMTKYCITIDADGQHYLEDIDKLYLSIVKNDADMIIGSRKGHNSASKFRGLGKWIIRNFAKVFMRIDVYDINSGMKVFQTHIAKKYLHLCPDGMPYSDIITLLFIHNRHLVFEEKINIKNRMGGESTINVNTAFETIMEILNILILFSPMKLFMPISTFFFTFGIVWGGYQFLMGRGVTVGSNLLVIMGIITFLLGLIAEQLSNIRSNMK